MDEISFIFNSPLQAEAFCDFLDDLGIDYEQNQCIVTINDTDDCDEVREAVENCYGSVMAMNEDKEDEEESEED